MKESQSVLEDAERLAARRLERGPQHDSQ